MLLIEKEFEIEGLEKLEEVNVKVLYMCILLALNPKVLTLVFVLHSSLYRVRFD